MRLSRPAGHQFLNEIHLDHAGMLRVILSTGMRLAVSIAPCLTRLSPIARNSGETYLAVRWRRARAMHGHRWVGCEGGHGNDSVVVSGSLRSTAADFGQGKYCGILPDTNAIQLMGGAARSPKCQCLLLLPP